MAVIIPTLNAGRHLESVIRALKEQESIQPRSVLVVDSGSRDGTIEQFREFGAEVVGLGGRPYNHGGTRRYGTELRPKAKFYVLLTHDAIPATPDAIARILAAFENPDVGMAYGRQLPRPDAKGVERHARLYNYPPNSEVRGYRDRARLGVKATFCSNSFAAYRADALSAVGGFPKDSYFAEDQFIAGKMLLAGKDLAYSADACVIHSHPYSLTDDFRRYFDCGVWHRRDRWLLDEFGEAEGEGVRFVQSEMRYLARHDPSAMPLAALRSLAKFLGYKLGLKEHLFSPKQKKKLAMQSFYWAQQESMRIEG
ncbi:glycosyltransferase [Mycolicibacterium aurum]|uniref:glycosyltransferase n=1 Tax=Mycolicibacterium aurum TaxID=1791 RepID=UPI0018D558EC|nr:glycosyltransferase [Mycolicibacterium aurum]